MGKKKVYNHSACEWEQAEQKTCPRCRGFGSTSADESECPLCDGYGKLWMTTGNWVLHLYSRGPGQLW